MATITILNWAQFQPRTDRANHSWMRVENSIIFSETLEGLSADQKWFWVCLLAYAQRKQTATFDFNVTYFEKYFGVSEKKMREALEHLHRYGAITLDLGGCQTPTDTVVHTTDRQTDNTNRTDKTDSDSSLSPSELVETWNRERGPFPSVSKLTDIRRDKARSQIAKYPDPTHWLAVLARWKLSDFCRDKWQPSFDDWLNETKRINTLEGKYDNREVRPVSPSGESIEAFKARMLRESAGAPRGDA